MQIFPAIASKFTWMFLELAVSYLQFLLSPMRHFGDCLRLELLDLRFSNLSPHISKLVLCSLTLCKANRTNFARAAWIRGSMCQLQLKESRLAWAIPPPKSGKLFWFWLAETPGMNFLFWVSLKEFPGQSLVMLDYNSSAYCLLWRVLYLFRRSFNASHLSSSCTASASNQLRKNKRMCYPQQLGRSWKDFVSEPFGTLSAMCNGHLNNSVCYLHQNHPELHRLLNQNLPEPHQLSAPKQSGSLSAFCHYAIELSTNLACYLHRNPPNLISHPEPSRTLSAPHRSKPHQPSAPEPSGTSSAICTGTLRNLISHLHWNPPELHQPSAPEPSGISSAICTRTLRNFISFLRHNPPELHQPSAPEPSGISSAICAGTLRNLIICTGTLRNLISHLPRNPPEPSPEPGVATAPDRTRAILG